MLSFRNGVPTVICDGCYKPIGVATVLLSDEQRARLAYDKAAAPVLLHLQERLLAVGREYAALHPNGWVNLVFTDKRDGSRHDVHEGEPTPTSENPCTSRILDRPTTKRGVPARPAAPTPEELHYAAIKGEKVPAQVRVGLKRFMAQGASI